MKRYLLPALLAALLAGCGGSGNSVNGSGGNGGSASAGADDTFAALVFSQFMDQSDTADVKPIDAITVTAPENTEPAVI